MQQFYAIILYEEEHNFSFSDLEEGEFYLGIIDTLIMIHYNYLHILGPEFYAQFHLFWSEARKSSFLYHRYSHTN